MTPDERKPATAEANTLLRVAARDCKTFELLRDITEAPLSSICFHAQQAVEKWLKAVLVSHGVVFGRTHDLEELAGVLTEFTSGVFFFLYSKTLGQINVFHDKLVDMQKTALSHLASSASEAPSDKKAVDLHLAFGAPEANEAIPPTAVGGG